MSKKLKKERMNRRALQIEEIFIVLRSKVEMAFMAIMGKKMKMIPTREMQ